MPPPNRLPSDTWMDVRVEAYVDNTLPPDEQTRFEARMWVDSHWEKQVERARSIRVSLRSKTPPPAPTELTDTILRRAAVHSCPEQNP